MTNTHYFCFVSVTRHVHPQTHCQLQSAAHLHIPLLCSANCNLLHTFTSHSSAVPVALAVSCTPSHPTLLQCQLLSAAHLHIPLLQCQLQSVAHLHIPLLCRASCNQLHTFIFHSSAAAVCCTPSHSTTLQSAAHLHIPLLCHLQWLTTPIRCSVASHTQVKTPAPLHCQLSNNAPSFHIPLFSRLQLPIPTLSALLVLSLIHI